MRRTLLAGAGGVLAGIFGSLCCIGPVALGAVGAGTALAGVAGALAPYRVLFGLAMVLSFGVGFSTVYGRRRVGAPHVGDDAEPGPACAVPQRNRRDRAFLWAAAALAAVFWSFPTWSKWIV